MQPCSGSAVYYALTADHAGTVTNGAIVIHTQRLKSDPGGNLLS
ncbi:glutathione S-transferase [Escherichia coli O21]|nr:glutathione S-transferase [Escherichia coli O21]